MARRRNVMVIVAQAVGVFTKGSEARVVLLDGEGDPCSPMLAWRQAEQLAEGQMEDEAAVLRKAAASARQYEEQFAN